MCVSTVCTAAAVGRSTALCCMHLYARCCMRASAPAGAS
eukprot:CAMPEP_0202878280 /NCGR_PEP_ID=MMETSP1391-20130828/31947_1 /ASSEMBLY_ACC=CAM_ASM_000867 /TAXON_ID=1034604 /ORGANISM="Chlamydomonas leiostraca, Strain SAG 11-49" /LENGTH=38 /DNA_ID= /DNA_START= /DNA_END= /DNA_ORIENTATION=